MTVLIKHLLGVILTAALLTGCNDEFVEDFGQCQPSYELDQYASLGYGSAELFVDFEPLHNGVYLTALVKLPTGSPFTIALESPSGTIGTTTAETVPYNFCEDYRDEISVALSGWFYDVSPHQQYRAVLHTEYSVTTYYFAR